MSRCIVLLLSVSLLAACATQEELVPKRPVAATKPVQASVEPPTVQPEWRPEPALEPVVLSFRGNSTYRVGETKYHVWRRIDDYVAEGRATWRNSKFDAHTSITGKAFENEALTGAHRYLPIPSYLKVTNLANGEQAIVKVTDRGPFRSDDLIDLSRGAAMRLGFGNVGSRPVRIELVNQTGTQYALETNYVYGRDAALAIVKQLRQLELGHLDVVVIPHQYENRFRVKIGRFASIDDANYVATWLASNAQVRSSVLQE